MAARSDQSGGCGGRSPEAKVELCVDGKNGARKMVECAPAMATGNDKTRGQAKNAKTNYPRNVEQRIGQE